MAKPRTSKVTKPTPPSSSSSKTTKYRSKFTGSSGSLLQRMVDGVTVPLNTESRKLSCEQTMQASDRTLSSENEVIPSTTMDPAIQDSEVLLRPRSKGKGRLVDSETDFTFPIMQLPTEIRLEIYRACLTRPKKIMLSKPEKPLQVGKSVVESIEEDTSSVVEETNAARADERATSYRLASPLQHETLFRPPVFARSNEQATSGHAQLQRPRTRSSLNGRSNSLSISHRSSSGSSITSGSNAAVLPPGGAIASSAPNASLTFEGWEPLTQKHNSNSIPTIDDPLVINILRASKEIYKEARDVLYSENVFEIDLNTALNSLAALHQRSRRHIKHIELDIPTYTEILERFSEVVRLSLRYCTGLKTLVIRTPFTLPGADGSTAASNTTVYANGFDILRWLPQQCQVVLEGCHNPEIDAVVSKHLNLAKKQDKVTYARRMFAVREWES